MFLRSLLLPSHTTKLTHLLPGAKPRRLRSGGADDRARTGDLVLTKDALYPLSYIGTMFTLRILPSDSQRRLLERETGIEPATNSLEGCDSTIELLPPKPELRPPSEPAYGRPADSVGAGGGIRTPDRLITNQMLYRLSYASPDLLFILAETRKTHVAP